MTRSLRRSSLAGLSLLAALATSVAWAEPSPGVPPLGHVRHERVSSYPLLVEHALAFDRGRGRAVMHKPRLLAEGAEPVAETWELVGDSFELVSDKGPVPGAYAQMVYDEKNAVMLLMPAKGPSGKQGLWAWDGQTWTERDSSLIKQPSASFTFVYHRKLEKVFFYEHYYRGAWLYDGVTWDKVSAGKTPQDTPPESGNGLSAAYDDERAQIIVFGGLGSKLMGKEFWTWDADAGWGKVAPKGLLPKSRYGAAMVFDEVRREVIMSGGSDGSLEEFTDTWSWDGKGWNQLDKSGGPPLAAAPAAWDSTNQRALVVGSWGVSERPFRYHVLEGSTWSSRVLSARMPAGRTEHLLAADEADGSLLLFGGLLRASLVGFEDGDAWRFRQGSWEQLAGPLPPSHRGVAQAPLPGGGILLFGGALQQGFSSETWLYEAGAFRRLSPAAAPSPRRDAAMVRQGDGSVLLLGGRGEQGALGDLWRWDGQGWSVVEPGPGPRPEARYEARLAYHPGQDRVFLFGGRSSLGVYSDTWSWDGERWARLEIASPQYLPQSSMVHDTKRNLVLLRLPGEFWSFDGKQWARLPEEGAEVLPPGSQLVHDPVSGQSFSFGGDLSTNHEADGTLRRLAYGGQPCSPESPCPSGSCVDGVCCSQAACGFCEACNVPGHEGSCTALAANEKDADSCASDQACDGKGGCKQALGATCSAASDCAGAFCTGGFCCLEKACDGACSSCEGQAAGVCGVVVERPNPGKCDRSNRCDVVGECKAEDGQSCEMASECASGRCEQGLCLARDARVCLPGNIALLSGGVRVPCGAYRCQEGSCLQKCTTTADCAEGTRCDEAGRCSADSVTASAEQGCNAGGAPGGWRLAALVACLVFAARRRAGRWALVGLLGALPSAEARPRATPQLVAPWHFPPNLPALALDPATGETLSFGGSGLRYGGTGSYIERRDEFWSWDGATYRRLDGDGPGPRSPTGFAHDPRQDRFLLLGNTGYEHQDLWVWDRSSWSPLPTALTPILESTNALHWDAAGQRMLLVHPSSAAEKILEFTGSDWKPVPGSAGGPTSRSNAALGFDPGRGVIVVVGGSRNSSEMMGDIWEWDGSSWQDRTPPPEAPRPPPIVEASVAYHPGLQRLVFCGGIVSATSATTLRQECSGWDGQTWSPLPTIPVTLLQLPTLFHDPKQSSLVLRVRPDQDPEMRTALVLTEQGWQSLPPQPEPPPLISPSGAYDPGTQQAVFFGGRSLLELPSEATWIHDAKGWRRLPATAGGPPGLSWSAMAHDPNQGGLLLFGGALPTDALGNADTWLFKGETWTKLAPASSPSPRDSHEMVTDTKRNRILLFGGTTGLPLGIVNETWAWDGATWSQLFPDQSPSPGRMLPLMEYDEARDRVVLFGGQASGQVLLDDTWEFDGDTWERKTPAHSPPPMVDPSSFYDPVLRKVILMGGATSYSPFTTTAAIWSWDGEDWQELNHAPVLGVRSDGVAVYVPELRGGLALPNIGANQQYDRLGALLVRVVGNACSSGEECSTERCTDGVCCEQAACDPCHACGLPGTEGTCAPLPRGESDGRCGKGQVCGDGRCVALPGAACDDGSECLSGSCVDGVCCTLAACGACQSCAVPGREGQCTPILDVEDPDSCSGDRRCSSLGQCRKADLEPCDAASECASGVCLDGGCKPTAPPYCDGDHTLHSAQGTFDCGAYRCTPEGACRTRCASTTDCASGRRCDAEGVCVAELVETSQAGCALAGRPGASRLAWAGLGLAALLCLARRRPR